MVHDLIVIEQDIKVYIPWPLIDHLDSAHLILNGLESIQQSQRSQSSFDLGPVSLLYQYMRRSTSDPGSG